MSSRVEFDEDSFSYGARQPGRPTGSAPNSYGNPGATTDPTGQPWMVAFLMKRGFAKTPQQAQMWLVGLIAINLIITFIVISKYL